MSIIASSWCQRTKWAYIFGAICPQEGKGIGLILPWCNTEAMNIHLAEIAAAVDPDTRKRAPVPRVSPMSDNMFDAGDADRRYRRPGQCPSYALAGKE